MFYKKSLSSTDSTMEYVHSCAVTSRERVVQKASTEYQIMNRLHEKVQRSGQALEKKKLQKKRRNVVL